MRNGKHRLGLIGLCLTAAFALTAFVGASGAQAAGCTAASPTLKPCWMVNGNVTSELKVELGIEIEPLGEKKEKHVVLLSKALEAPIAILCEVAEAVNPEVLLAEGVAHGTINFTVCQTFLKNEPTPSAACKPAEPIVAKGLLLINLHPAGKANTLAEPTPGVTKFTTISLGEECAVGEKFDVTGQLWLEDCLGTPETELEVHLVQENTVAAKELGGLFFGVNKASLDGSANIRIKEAGVAKKFSVLAA
jgi:hypothetical protein